MAWCIGMMWALALTLGAPPAPVTVAITAHVAAPEGQPVVDRGWLQARVDRANVVFAPYGLQFTLGAVEALDTPIDALVRADRNALAPRVRPQVVNLFVVRKLMDIHEAGRIRRGVHWKVRKRGVHYVIMASYAGEGILAHELGHFFGNPRHRHVAGNLMSYVPWPGVPTLDPDQAEKVRRALRRFVRSGELKPVVAAPASP